jgi:S1-C subfamily serine protease
VTAATINGQDIVVHGDIILDIDGIRIDSVDDLPRVREKMAAMKSGAPIKITVLRAGKVMELTGKIP